MSGRSSRSRDSLAGMRSSVTVSKMNQQYALIRQNTNKALITYVTGFAERYLFHTQNLTHFVNFDAL